MLAKKHRHWKTIECIQTGKMLAIEVIQEKILSLANLT
jgi:hypothetical protein